ncbi:CsbD family protein [Marinactinospora thermotolerans]|uniref:CsbD-like n=1 Tax=Marinactinospora thermotolerans DSM 45154 TaxID=1122192 RepID=A0A1T4SXI9_9ACTN|nr:CsbD family protein [Marinactinospora thermotolerans]SKA32974.1 CsbD-like [Marinactinospora thermotolerans DSM 45154]
MSTGKKVEAKGQQVKGKAEETVGKATGNDRLKNKGRADMVEGKGREVGQDAKSAFKR